MARKQRTNWPEIKRYGSISADDLQRHPVWICCHTADEGEDWFDEAGEDDYRPHGGGFPRPPVEDLYMVGATATLGDGTEVPAFLDLSPVGGSETWVMASVVAPDEHFSFQNPVPGTEWMGGIAKSYKARVLDSLGKREKALFPIVVEPHAEAAAFLPTVRVTGWKTLEISWPSLPELPE